MSGRTKLTVAYLGSGFSGWQRQDAVRTVQGELERAIAGLIGGTPVAVVGAGRTDAGVHATAQVAHVDLPVALPRSELPRILNARLAQDLRIRTAVAVDDGFHARRDARFKHYAYRIAWQAPDLPWLGLRTAVLPVVTEPRRLEEACRLLPGRRDWASFTVPEAARIGTVRELFRVEPRWRRGGLELHFLGGGFLRYQVRRIVAALLEVGRGRMPVAELIRLIERPSPGAPLPTAPARGLTLERVGYRRLPSAEVGNR
ncbi:MAG: tRNA pseudouridine(38-40) synthase TruA [Thermoanaerobaculales bacterium]|jgi:tRNA pseudouridine38-40 synthase|nr:tRNA pseudouridine(38-40) synthase TruA [Thermoanaerobaculales bacterium]